MTLNGFEGLFPNVSLFMSVCPFVPHHQGLAQLGGKHWQWGGKGLLTKKFCRSCVQICVQFLT